MASKIVRVTLVVLAFIGLVAFGFLGAISPVQAETDNSVGGDIQVMQTGPVYSQPVDPNGKLLPSARRDPDGSDYDEYVWDDFTLSNGGTISQIDWYGGYDPLKSGRGGPVTDFTVSIYPSIAADTEPAVANPPLVEYQTGGKAGEIAFTVVNGIQINLYSFSLPTSFVAEAGTKYWIYIVASQQGNSPDWGFISATGGSGNHYIKTSGAGGDVLYRFAPGDVAFTLLGPSSLPMTSTPEVTVTLTPSDTPVVPSTETPPVPTSTPVPQQIPTCLGSIFTLMMFMIFLSDLRTR
ncbi:MAG: hypothetical protein QM730_09780 [Anaerolineales bacterium]